MKRKDEPCVCVSCNTRGSQCAEQRRELVPSAAEKTKSNLKERVAKLEAIIEASGLSAHDITLNQSAARRADGLRDPLPNSGDATFLATDSSAHKATPLSSSHHSGTVLVNVDLPHETDPVATLFNNAFVLSYVLCVLASV